MIQHSNFKNGLHTAEMLPKADIPVYLRASILYHLSSQHLATDCVSASEVQSSFLWPEVIILWEIPQEQENLFLLY